MFKWLNNLIYLNLERNQIVSLGDVFLDYFDLKKIKMANNGLRQLPNFEIKSYSDRPISLDEIDLDLNGFNRIDKISNAVSQIKLLKFDSNNISSIEDDAFANLNELKTLFLYNNSLKNLTKNAFSKLFSLEYLNLSTNKIIFIEPGTFQNLNKLLTLDLSQNLLFHLNTGVFNGLIKD
jgi:Leucine-rich repeat (LRR) protein